MPKAVIIRVESPDEDDISWLRDKCVPVVEDCVEEQKEEDRVHENTEVTWKYED